MKMVDEMAGAGAAAPAGNGAAAIPAPGGGASYPRVAVTLHWLIALLIIGQIGLGFSLDGLSPSPARGAVIGLHKSIGITILLLSLVRLGWRLTHKPPPHVPMPLWQGIASAVVHWSFYVIMIAMPLTGWIMVSSTPVAMPTVLYGLVPWPAVPGLAELAPSAKAAVNAFGKSGHVFLAFSAVTLLLLHLGAVAKHQFIDRDGSFAHMAPGARPGWKEKRLWLALACVVIVAMLGRNYASMLPAGRQGPPAKTGQMSPSTAEGNHGPR
jgi:cytochrome b561